MSKLKELERFDQSVWIDFIRRSLLTDGGLEKLIREDAVKGLTSNPAIFEKAIGSGREYRAALAEAARLGDADPERVYERIAIADIQMAADLMKPVYEVTSGRDGFVSLEVSPKLANDTARTLSEAHRLWDAVARPNLMIKVPGTSAGVPAVEQLITEGINVNVTLLFSVERYTQVAEAYIRGLESRVAVGKPVKGLASVASFFVSRIDTEIDSRLEALAKSAKSDAQRTKLIGLRGKAAVANAKHAYAHYKRATSRDRWKSLSRHGAHTQRLLWASTSTKNPDYPDTLYVDELIGPETVNTMPPNTLDAFRDHGKLEAKLEHDLSGAGMVFADLEHAGISIREVTDKLLTDGVKLFADAFDRLLEAVSKARKAA
ncbi:MAG: transaldolase [Burkholderiales bacterium]